MGIPCLDFIFCFEPPTPHKPSDMPPHMSVGRGRVGSLCATITQLTTGHWGRRGVRHSGVVGRSRMLYGGFEYV